MKKSKKFSFKELNLKLSENNKLTKAISIIFLILIMSGLFAFIITGLYRFGLLKLPAFIENIFIKPAGDNLITGNDDRNIYDFLKNNAESAGDNLYGGGYSLEYTLDNIRDAIKNISMPDNIYLETEAKYYIDGKSARTEKMFLWKKGEKYKYELVIDSELNETYINDSKTELIENFRTGSKIIKSASEAFSFDSIPHIQNINYYLDLLEGGEMLRCFVRPNSDSNIVEIQYSVPELDQWELIYISLDTGIVLEVRCFVGENADRFYECKTNVIESYYDGDEQSAAKSSIQDSLFAIK